MMKTYPLGLDEELLAEVRRTAADTGLSQADAMRQALKRGLPQVREALSARPAILDGLRPLTRAQCEDIWGSKSDKEHDAFVRHCAGLPAGRPPE
jgi:hypothetical protein